MCNPITRKGTCVSLHWFNLIVSNLVRNSSAWSCSSRQLLQIILLFCFFGWIADACKHTVTSHEKVGIFNYEQQTLRLLRPAVSFDHPDQLERPREEDGCDKSHANTAWFEAAPGLMPNLQEKDMDKWDHMKSRTVLPTFMSETCPHHNITDRAVALEGPTESRTTAGRGEVELCL